MNLLLDAVSPADKPRLMAALHPVAMPLRAELFAPQSTPPFVHFVTSGLASVVSTVAQGDAVEVGIVGSEGMPETLHLLGPLLPNITSFMQVEGTALRMDFRDFQRDWLPRPSISRLVLAHAQFRSFSLSQLAVCNRLHSLEQRLARWLLQSEDRVGSPTLNLTQEFLAEMLGAQRSTVTLIAGSLQRAGLIEYQRGRITILRRPELERTTCECYQILRDMFNALYT